VKRARLGKIACVVVAALGCASCSLWWRGQGDHIRAPHERHAQAKVDCVVCHEPIYDATTLDGGFLPAEKICLGCHKEASQKGQCSMCHTDVRHAGPWAPRTHEVKVSHADHFQRTKEDCRACHKALPEPFASAERKPTMAACLSCHEHQADYDEARSTKCHSDLSRYPLRPITGFSHQGNYTRAHAADARAAADRCATCHEQTFCADCHASTVATKIEFRLPERVDRAFIHRGDYVGRHVVEARAEPASCRRCHGTSFCESCHQAQNLTPSSVSPRDPHPPGWALPGSADFHGTAARRDIASCAPCHDQGARSICVDCHKVGGIGGDPHPLGWATRHPRSEIQHNGMCVACHL
jgi:hypothetical protein